MKIPFLSKSEPAIDPVCHMEVNIGNPSGGTAERGGNTYYFCGPGCRVAFQRQPEAYSSVSAPQGSLEEQTGDGERGKTVSKSVGLPSGVLDFRLTETGGTEGQVEVEYQCPCGCTPKARFHAGSTEPGSEHCCCGRVHFAGPNAEQMLQAYMLERGKSQMDEDVGLYTYSQFEMTSATNRPVGVAYAQPARPRK